MATMEEGPASNIVVVVLIIMKMATFCHESVIWGVGGDFARSLMSIGRPGAAGARRAVYKQERWVFRLLRPK